MFTINCTFGLRLKMKVTYCGRNQSISFLIWRISWWLLSFLLFISWALSIKIEIKSQKRRAHLCFLFDEKKRFDRVPINHFIKAICLRFRLIDFMCLHHFAYTGKWEEESTASCHRTFFMNEVRCLMHTWQWCFCHLPICFQFLIVNWCCRIESNERFMSCENGSILA